MEQQKRTKLFLHLKKWLEKAAMDFGMIEKGDRILVGVSGGADSLALLDLLNTPMLYIPSEYSLVAAHVDLGFEPDSPAYPILEDHLREGGYTYFMEKTAIGPYAHGELNRKNPCFLCSRLRRKRLFEVAGDYGCNKVALAHHKDDIIETLMINILYGREISTMLPRQDIFQGKMSIIRPFAYIREELVKKYARERGFPVVDNACPTSRNSRRALVKGLLREFEKDNGNIRENIFKALRHVKPDYLPFPLQREEAGGGQNG